MSASQSQSGRGRWVAFGVLLLLLSLNVGIHLSLLHAAPYLDEGDFTSSGECLREGGLFYADTWNERGPFVYYLTAALFAVAPPTLESARLLALVLSCLQIVLLYLLARSWTGTATALLAPLFYLVWHPLVMGTFYLPEQTSGVLALAALYLLFGSGEGPTWPRAAAAGVLASCMVMNKQTAVFFAAALGVLLAVRRSRRRSGRGGVVSYLLAVPLPWVLLAVPYLLRGELRTLLWGLLFPLTNYRTGAYVSVARQLRWALYGPLFAAIGGYLVRMAVRRRPFDAPYLVWTAGALITAGPSFFAHHALILLPPASVAVAGLAEAVRLRHLRPLFATVLAGVVLASGISAVATRAWRDAVYDRTRWDEVAGVAAYIRARTADDDRIWVFPHKSDLYLFSGRRAATRFPFLLPWTASDRVLQEIVRTIEGPDAPALIVYTHFYGDTSPGIHPGRFARPVIEAIARRYRIAARSPSGLLVLTRRPRGTPPDAGETARLARVLGQPDAAIPPGVPRIAPLPPGRAPADSRQERPPIVR